MESDEPVIVLEDRATDRRLRVPVSPFEASAILLEMEGISAPRPLTHDLLAEFFSEGGFSLDEASFFGDQESGIRARISYHKGIRRFAKEVRPSDALALSLRLSAPLRAAAVFLDKQQRLSLPWHRPRILGLKEWKDRALRA